MSKKKEYIKANLDWLVEKSKEDGVHRLSDGVYYRVIASGNNVDKRPTVSSIISVHYTGWTIDGKQFDTSVGSSPLTIRLRQLIEGWIIALPKMCVGDKWEIYLDAERGYGSRSIDGIPGGSTLIFEIELLRIG